LAIALADLRLGDAEPAASRIIERWTSSPALDAAARAVEAAALARMRLTGAAAVPREIARAAADRLPRPDRGEYAVEWWVLQQTSALLREAAGGAAPAESPRE
jgi:hypothetical protein